MKYRISIAAIWRYETGHLHAGEYRVPEDVNEELAQRVLKEGAAVKVGVKSGAPENKKAEHLVEGLQRGHEEAVGYPSPLDDDGLQSPDSGEAPPPLSSEAVPPSARGRPRRSKVTPT